MRRMILMTTLGLVAMWMAPQAVAGEMADMVRRTLAQGADPNAWVKGDLGSKTHPLIMVVGYSADHVEAGRLLLEAGADPNGQDSHGRSALLRAASLAAVDFVNMLLAAKADPNLADNSGNTPLHGLDDVATYLAFSGDKMAPEERARLARGMEIVARALVKAGADPNRTNSNRETPLHLLVQHASGAVIETLLEAGARPKVKTAKGETPLSLAVRYAHDPTVVKALLTHGADARSVSLVSVIADGRLQEAGYLIDHGADVMARGLTRDTPLHAAVYQALDAAKAPAALKLIRKLVDQGASPDARNDLDATPRGMAQGHPDILALFGETRAAPTPSKPVAAPGRRTSRPAPAETASRRAKPRKTASDSITVSKQIGTVLQAVMTEVNRYGQAQASTQGPAAEAADLAALDSADAIPQRIKTLNAYREAVNAMIGALVAAPARALIRARHLGLDSETAHRAFVKMREAMNKVAAPALIAKMQAERNWVNAVVRGYRLLAANRDSWRPNTESDNPPIFIRDQAFVDTFLEAIDEIAAAERRTNAATDAVAEARANGG